MSTMNIMVERGNALTCYDEKGHMKGSIAAIRNDITIQIDTYVLSHFVKFEGDGAFIQISCASYDVNKIGG